MSPISSKPLAISVLESKTRSIAEICLSVSYASMLSDGQQAADFLKVLYPTVKASGLKTEIACCDGSGWEQQRERLDGLEAAGAEYTLGLVTAHGYSSPPSTPFDTTGKVWETEW